MISMGVCVSVHVVYVSVYTASKCVFVCVHVHMRLCVCKGWGPQGVIVHRGTACQNPECPVQPQVQGPSFK